MAVSAPPAPAKRRTTSKAAPVPQGGNAEARRRMVGGRRLYEWRRPGAPLDEAPERFWSVTTILKGGLPSPALTAWGMKAVAEYAAANHRQLAAMTQTVRLRALDDGSYVVSSDPNALRAAIDWLKGAPYRERDRKAGLGTAVHEQAEAYVLGKPMPEPPAEIAGHVAAYRQFLADYEPVYELAEATVYSRKESYAGTLDAIAVLPSIGRVLIDYKTGSGVYPEAGLQLSMYRFGDFIGLPDGTEMPVPQVDGCAVLHLREDGYELIPVVADQTVFKCALYVREVFRWAEEISKTVIGQPLPKPPRTTDFARGKAAAA